MNRFTKVIENITRGAAKLASWFTLILIVLICLDVLLRYALNDTNVWILELEWQLFATIFLLGGAYTLQKNKHVRVDVWYGNLSMKGKAIIDSIGTLFLLLPFLYILIISSWSYASYSYSILEGSPDPGGLPGRYIIKFMIPLGFFLLALQAFVGLVRDVITILQAQKNLDKD